jgi:Leucine-rich repeat (LRR) protein
MNKNHIMLTDGELRKSTTFKTIKSALVNPEEVYKLSLRVNEMSEEMRQFKNLQTLDLNQSSWIKKMPDWIGDFPNLQVLNLCEMSYSNLPASITNLQNLHTLDISFNSDLKVGFEHIYKLKKLRKLKMDCNNFKLSAEIKNLTNLEVLQLGYLKDTSELEHIYELSNLKKLELVGGESVRLINGISKMKNLESFTACVLPLEQLPDDFSELPKLKEFTYTGLYNVYLENHTTPNFKLNINWGHIFEELSQIKTLQSVDLSDNKIKKYHQNMGLLSQIKKLNLKDMVRETTEESFPNELLGLSNLKELTISDRDLEREFIKNLGVNMPNVKLLVK